MTHRDYVRIARAIKRVADRTDNDTEIKQVVAELAHELHFDNPRFDRQRFADACGVSA